MALHRKAVAVASMLGAIGVGGVVGAVAWSPTASGAATGNPGTTAVTTPAANTDNPAGAGSGAPSGANPSPGARTPDGDCPHGARADAPSSSSKTEAT